MRSRAQLLAEFLGRTREYLPPENGEVGHRASGNEVPTQANIFGSFDSEVMLAFSRAVEDIALEDAYGRLLSSFQDFTKFQTHRERYNQIAATLDEVLVLGVGRQPAGCDQIQFLNCGSTVLGKYWMAMYQGDRVQVLAISRQVNDAKAIPDKIFRGFFTFDARLISRIRRDVLDTVAGRWPVMPIFERLSVLDEAGRQVRGGFQAEIDALEAELARFRQYPHRSPRGYLDELDHSLERLAQLRQSVVQLFYPNEQTPELAPSAPLMKGHK